LRPHNAEVGGSSLLIATNIIGFRASLKFFSRRIEIQSWVGIDRLRQDCAKTYLIVDYFYANEESKATEEDFERALDNFLAVANGEPRPYDDLMPGPN